MDARHLRVFLAVAEEGGVTGAARKLRLAQPSVSQTLGSIEREVGVRLFHRLGRGLAITPAGEALLGPARHALRTLDGVTDGIEKVTQLKAGRLDVGALALLATDPMAALIGSFRQKHPGISIRLLEAEEPADLTASVRDGTCEIALVHYPSSAQGLSARRLGWQELHWVFPPGTQLRPGPIATSDLAEVPLVVAPRGTSTRLLLEQAFAAADVEPRIVVETSTRERTLPLVLGGAGVALFPSVTAANIANLGAVVRPAEPPIRREIGFIHRAAPLSPAGSAFLDHAA